VRARKEYDLNFVVKDFLGGAKPAWMISRFVGVPRTSTKKALSAVNPLFKDCKDTICARDRDMQAVSSISPQRKSRRSVQESPHRGNGVRLTFHADPRRSHLRLSQGPLPPLGETVAQKYGITFGLTIAI